MTRLFVSPMLAALIGNPNRGFMMTLASFGLLVFALALIQSTFGVGLLLLGTPLLILAGYAYFDVLWMVLPASLLVSLSQVWAHRRVDLGHRYRRSFFLYALPGLFIGLSFSGLGNPKLAINVLIFVCVTIALLHRVSEAFNRQLREKLVHHYKKALFGIGIIHGISNMAGAFLTPLAFVSFGGDREKALASISFDYLFLALFQLICMSLFHLGNPRWEYILVGAGIALPVNLIFSRKLKGGLSGQVYYGLSLGLFATILLISAYNVLNLIK